MENLIGVSELAAPLVPVSIAATTKTGLVDKQGFAASIFHVLFGALGGTYSSSDKYTITLEASDTVTDVDFAVVTDATHVEGTFSDITTGTWLTISSGTIRDAIKSKAWRLAYLGPKRYSRLVFTKAANGPDTLAGVSAINFGARYSDAPSMIPDFGAGNLSAAPVAAS